MPSSTELLPAGKEDMVEFAWLANVVGSGIDPRWGNRHLGLTPSEKFVHFGIRHFPVVLKRPRNAAFTRDDSLNVRDFRATGPYQPGFPLSLITVVQRTLVPARCCLAEKCTIGDIVRRERIPHENDMVHLRSDRSKLWYSFGLRRKTRSYVGLRPLHTIGSDLAARSLR